MTSANGFTRHARQALRLACVMAVAAALAGCGLAQDVARQAGMPDSVYKVLFADGKTAATPAAPTVAPAPAPKQEARRTHRRRHHAKGHANDKAPSPVAPNELGTTQGAKDADAGDRFTDHVPPPVASSDSTANAEPLEAAPPAPAAASAPAAPKAAPHAEQHAASSPQVPSGAARRQVEEKVYAAIQYCKQLHVQGGLDSYQQTAECMGPRIWAAWHEANYPYMDLIGLYVSTLERGAARLDRREITEAEFEQEMTRLQTRIAAEEQRRNLPAAQLTNISGTGGLAPTE